MNTSQESAIILEIVAQRASTERIADLCADLTNNYQTEFATANTPYTFGWGAGGGMSGEVKISVGSAFFLAEYDAVNQEVVMLGTCGTTEWDDFTAADQVLSYNKSGFEFEVQVELHNGNTLKIVVTPQNNATIQAFS